MSQVWYIQCMDSNVQGVINLTIFTGNAIEEIDSLGSHQAGGHSYSGNLKG